MPTYHFRCDEHGDFPIDQPMEFTTRIEWCPCCGATSPKVLSGRAMQFTYGKSAFHDGPEGTGKTVRETAQEWVADFKRDKGYDPEPATRWV